jgi:hypothetical protein
LIPEKVRSKGAFILTHSDSLINVPNQVSSYAARDFVHRQKLSERFWRQLPPTLFARQKMA